MPETEPPKTEAQADRLKRMRMRAWRRGMKEMDLILGPYADARLGGMDDAALVLFDALLARNDPELYQWVIGTAPAPARFAPMIAAIALDARGFVAGENR